MQTSFSLVGALVPVLWLILWQLVLYICAAWNLAKSQLEPCRHLCSSLQLQLLLLPKVWFLVARSQCFVGDFPPRTTVQKAPPSWSKWWWAWPCCLPFSQGGQCLLPAVWCCKAAVYYSSFQLNSCLWWQRSIVSSIVLNSIMSFFTSSSIKHHHPVSSRKEALHFKQVTTCNVILHKLILCEWSFKN